MKHRRVIGVLFSGLVLASTAAAPHAVADPCRWIAHDLPVPDDSRYARTSGSSENNRFIVGEAKVGESSHVESGLVWDNGVLTRMTPSGWWLTAIRPTDVNNSGVVVGRQEILDQHRTVAFRYRDGAYELLDTPEGLNSQAKGVNNHGDVVGEVWQSDTPNTRHTTVWPNSGAAKTFLPGPAIGISDDGKVVQISGASGFVIDVETGQRTELPGGKQRMVFDNDRVLHPSPTGLAEWNLAGQQVATWEAGTTPWGRTSSGHVVFGAVNGVATLWQWGVHYPVDSANLPVVASAYYGDVTDEGALIGTYIPTGGDSRPARWFWCG
ncbi:hypothetical protein SK803_03955 [Lentzea sp. BCCO 10_0856]|uniref:Uncharacterized protein n=1 Tax=Lentzea miocenica TaxID=3095431 RepID=A0ABU4STV8_9PSEU|nr:hypothetical protein [Lentzea sp. BCCO 10_0856]MDX8029347.1 hypothetical protein [Lentzea sp. BCCO 10_0856]